MRPLQFLIQNANHLYPRLTRSHETSVTTLRGIGPPICTTLIVFVYHAGVAERENVVGPARSHLLESEIDGDISIYDAKTEKVTVLNGTASDVWRLIDGRTSVGEIAELLASSYQVSIEDVATDVAETVARFAEAGLLESA